MKELYDIYNIAHYNLKQMLFTIPRIDTHSSCITFRLNLRDASHITKATIRKWFKDFSKNVEVYRERGNNWGRRQDYYDYTISLG